MSILDFKGQVDEFFKLMKEIRGELKRIRELLEEERGKR